jgi:hypothetical protein
MNEKVAQLVTTGKTEAERAAELKQKFQEALRPAMEVMDEANREGLCVHFHIDLDPFGRHTIQVLELIKKF